MQNKEQRILSKFIDIGAKSVEHRDPFILVFFGEKDKITQNHKYVLRIDRTDKLYQKYSYIQLSNVWQYRFEAMISYPIKEAEHKIITELFDYWRQVEWKQNKKKLK